MRVTFHLALSLLLCSCVQQSPPLVARTPDSAISPVAVENKQSTLPKEWYRDATFMEIYVRGFQDSDGDGIGDFNGLTSRLDYLQELGVRGIWLMPMMKSQDRDHGYAVMDYREVEPDYGTLADFQNFLTQAHQRGIGVIIDYVLNHSAADNPLFYDSNHDLGGKRDWYNWSRDDKGWRNWGGAPTWHPGEEGYYYGIFWDQMPDFNLRNEAVVRFHQDNLRYWLNMGVDGFRLDAVGTLFENGEKQTLNQPENHQLLKEQIAPVVHEYDNRFIVCENPDSPVQTADSCGAAFYFGMQNAIITSVHQGVAHRRIAKQIETSPASQMALFLSNHDSFAGDRLFEQFSGDEQFYKLAAGTMLTLPGIPFIYYGEEIGMAHAENHLDPDRDHRLRAPMSWTGDEQTAGFTSGKPFRKLASNVMSHNVAAQQSDPASLLNFYRLMINLRNAHPALRHGDFSLVKTHNRQILSFIRKTDDERLLVLINFNEQPERFDASVVDGKPEPLFNPADSVEGEPNMLKLPPLSVGVYRL